MRILALIIGCIGIWGVQTSQIWAQANRINTHGAIGWYNAFGTLHFNKKWGLHTEYQFRRDNFITDWQQSLLRVGVNYKPRPNLLLRAGYAWIETFAYGEIPINALGRTFTEHRTYQMAQLQHKEGIVDFSHRFMFEQRWVGRYSNASVTSEDEFPLLWRLRYMFRMQIPLKGKEVGDKTPYIALYDELFMGFGANVNANVFDQNRVGVMAGYKFNKHIRIEGGYLNQIVQFGRQIEGKNVFQYNHGIIVNALFDVYVKRKPKTTPVNF